MMEVDSYVVNGKTHYFNVYHQDIATPSNAVEKPSAVEKNTQQQMTYHDTTGKTASSLNNEKTDSKVSMVSS